MPHNQVATISFKIGDIVWAKIKGFVAWPARIVSISSKMAVVFWLNDYRSTKVYQTQIFKFLERFDEFSKRFSDTVGLETAAREGLMLFSQQLHKKTKLTVSKN